MPFEPGKSGNPKGQIKEKKFLGALERAIAQDDGIRLRQAAETLLNKAAIGEPWAVALLADRLDGKPKQDVDVQGGLTYGHVLIPVEQREPDPLGVAGRPATGSNPQGVH